MRHVSRDRQDVSGRPVIGPARVVAGVVFIVQQVPLQTTRVQQAARGVRSTARPREHRGHVHEVGPEGMDLPEEDRTVVTTIETRLSARRAPGAAWEVAAEISGEKRGPEPVEGRMVERTVQLTTLARDQGASNPEVDQLVDLEFSDRVEQPNVGVAAKMRAAPPDVAVKTFRVERKLDVLVDLPIDVNTRIVDLEIVTVMAPTRRPRWR